jgi:hypothetical protein
VRDGKKLRHISLVGIKRIKITHWLAMELRRWFRCTCRVGVVCNSSSVTKPVEARAAGEEEI